MVALAEAALRTALAGRHGAYLAAVDAIVPGRAGQPAARRHSTILLSKAARRLYFFHHLAEIRATAADDAAAADEASWVQASWPTMLQPGPELWGRFMVTHASNIDCPPIYGPDHLGFFVLTVGELR